MGIKFGNIDISKIKIASGLTPRLPSAYQEVEYIQSSGTQYINTGYTPLTTTEFDLTFEKVSQVSTWDCPFGTRKQYNQQAYYIGYVSSSSYYAFGNNHVDPSSVPFYSTGVKYNITYKNGVLSNGSQTANVSVNSSPYGNLHLFCDLDNGSISEKSAIKLYSFKLYESSTLVRDFVPCYRIADSVIGLYDVVNDVFYTNNGTGTFTKGEDVNLPYKEIKKVYLGSTQVRPSGGGGWQPGANTLLYFPLVSDAIDVVNNVSLTSSGTTNYTTVGGVTSAEFTQSNYLYNNSVNIIPQGDVAKTFSVWAYIKGHNTSWGAILAVGGSGAGETFGLGQYENDNDVIMSRSYSTSNRYTPTLNTWINFVMTYDNSVWTLYVNGQSQVTWNATAPTSGNSFYISQHIGQTPTYYTFYGNLSNVILEDKERTSQEVLDYFDLTKGNYGIS